MYAYDFQTNRIPGEPQYAPYWRDVGTIDAYYEANMDLRSVAPELNLYNREWPLRTASYPEPPAKFTFDEENRRGQAIDSDGLRRMHPFRRRGAESVLFRGVRVHAGAMVEDSIILDNCDIGRRAKVKRAILDKNVRVPEDAADRLRPGARPQVPPRHRKRHRGGGRQPFGDRSQHAVRISQHVRTDWPMDFGLRLSGYLRAAGVGDRGLAGAGRDAADVHRAT